MDQCRDSFFEIVRHAYLVTSKSPRIYSYSQKEKHEMGRMASSNLIKNYIAISVVKIEQSV